MESRQLKNIAILILLLLNAFLLLLLAFQYLPSRQSAADSARQLEELFAADQLSLSREVDLSSAPLSPLTLSRHTETEAAIAACLLGEEAEAVSLGGGIYSYSAASGAIQFRSGGSFDSRDLSLPVSDAADFARQFCSSFGYEEMSAQLSGGSGAVTATQQVAGVPIDGCGVALSFENNVLVSVSGAHISLEDAVLEEGEQMTCTTALIRFLDYRRTAGDVCRQVEAAQCIYELQSSPSSQRLIPVWQVVTDTYTYFVDCSSGAVSRR